MSGSGGEELRGMTRHEHGRNCQVSLDEVWVKRGKVRVVDIFTRARKAPVARENARRRLRKIQHSWDSWDGYHEWCTKRVACTYEYIHAQTHEAHIYLSSRCSCTYTYIYMQATGVSPCLPSGHLQGQPQVGEGTLSAGEP